MEIDHDESQPQVEDRKPVTVYMDRRELERKSDERQSDDARR